MKLSIMREMYRAEVVPMESNPEDRVQRTGLWKVVIYEEERFVRTERDWISYGEAKRLAGDLNGRLNIKTKAVGK